VAGGRVPTLLRAGLVLLALSELLVGVWALPWPRAFFDTFPLPGHTWVAYFPPYNEHFVRDVGAYSLALGVMLLVAAWRPEPLLVRTTLAGFLLYSVPRTVFHALHLHGFPPADAVAQTAGTVGLTLVAVLLVPLAPSAARSRTAPRPS
jgi:predicted anti-sigma-YlaC factor YlaD